MTKQFWLKTFFRSDSEWSHFDAIGLRQNNKLFLSVVSLTWSKHLYLYSIFLCLLPFYSIFIFLFYLSLSIYLSILSSSFLFLLHLSFLLPFYSIFLIKLFIYSIFLCLFYLSLSIYLSILSFSFHY